MTNNFDLIAPFYDALASLVYGNKVKLAPTFFFKKINEANDILVIGGGTGAILIPLNQHFPNATITFLEPSSKMMQRARNRVVSNVNYVQQTLESYNPDQKFDLIITPFVLDVYNEQQLQQAIDKVKCLLCPGGHWLHSDFHQGEKLWWQRLLIRIMYIFFRLSASLQQQKLLNFDGYFEAAADLSLIHI